MPGIPDALVKTVISGTTHGAQGWSTGFYCVIGAPTTFNQTELNDWNSGVATAISTDVGTIATNLFDTATTSLIMTSYFYAPNGLTASGVSVPAAMVHAGTTPSNMPSLCALVTSLRSATPGRSGRGRMYWPATAGILGSDGQVSGSVTGAVGVAWAGALTIVNGLEYTGDKSMSAVVASFTRGVAEPIVSVVTDSLVDVQHRRQDKLTSAHTNTTAVVPTP